MASPACRGEEPNTYIRGNKTIKEETKYPIAKLNFSSRGIKMLKLEEGFRGYPYDDDKPNEKLYSWTFGATIGYGHLIDRNEWSHYKKYLDGNMSEQRATYLLLQDVDEKGVIVLKRLLNSDVKLTQSQFDALVLLVYNIGPGSQGNMNKGFYESSVRKFINNSNAHTNYPTLEDAWLAWSGKAAGAQPLRGRRERELQLFNFGIYREK